MSSKNNHRRRSHKSQWKKRNAFGNLHKRYWITPPQRPSRTFNLLKVVRELLNLWRKRRQEGAREC